MYVYVLQHRGCQKRASNCNQKSHIRIQSTRPLGNITRWYSHSAMKALALARGKTPRLCLYKTPLPLHNPTLNSLNAPAIKAPMYVYVYVCVCVVLLCSLPADRAIVDLDRECTRNRRTVGPLIIQSFRVKHRVSTGALGALDDLLVVQTKL